MLTKNRFIFAATLGLAAHATAQTPVLLTDIDARAVQPINLGCEFQPLGVLPTVPPTLLFSAWTEAAGRELWATDGTAVNTRMIADWNPGTASSDPSRIVVLPDGSALVALDHPAAGREIHRVSNTRDDFDVELVADAAAGLQGNRYSSEFGIKSATFFFGVLAKGLQARRELKELHKSDGTTAEVVATFGEAPPGDATIVSYDDNTMCIGVDDGVHGKELWKSDGTTAGTTLVRDAVPGPEGSNPYEFTVVGDKLYFGGTFPGAGTEVLVFDGNDVTLAADVNPQGDSDPHEFIAWRDALLFVANNGSDGRELYQIDANGTFSRVADIYPGSAGSDPGDLSVIGQDLYFSADDGSNGRELWKRSPGAPPAMVRDFEPGSGSSNPSKVVQAGTTLALRASLGGDLQMWASRDNGGTWNRVTTARQGQGGANPRNITALGGDFVYAGDDDTVVDEVFIYEPVRGLARRLADVNGPIDQTRSANAGITGFTYCNGHTYFGASDANGFELWRSDGTAAGTMQVADLNPPNVSTSFIRDLVTIDATHLVMVANDTLHSGDELYSFDTNQAALSLIKDIRPGTGDSRPDEIAGPFRVGGVAPPVVFFSADDGSTGREPWCSDGTEAGTVLLGDLRPGSIGSFPNVFDGISRATCVLAAALPLRGSVCVPSVVFEATLAAENRVRNAGSPRWVRTRGRHRVAEAVASRRARIVLGCHDPGVIARSRGGSSSSGGPRPVLARWSRMRCMAMGSVTKASSLRVAPQWGQVRASRRRRSAQR